MIPFTYLDGRSFIETPDYIAKKKVCVNIQNKGENCFILTFLAARNPLKPAGKPLKSGPKAYRESSYRWMLLPPTDGQFIDNSKIRFQNQLPPVVQPVIGSYTSPMPVLSSV